MTTFTFNIANPKDSATGLTYEEIQDGIAAILKARPDIFTRKNIKISLTLNTGESK